MKSATFIEEVMGMSNYTSQEENLEWAMRRLMDSAHMAQSCIVRQKLSMIQSLVNMFTDAGRDDYIGRRTREAMLTIAPVGDNEAERVRRVRYELDLPILELLLRENWALLKQECDENCMNVLLEAIRDLRA